MSRALTRAVIFDLDGTLVDSLEDLAESMNAVLSRRGLPTHPVDAYRYYVGDGVVNLVQRALAGTSPASETMEDCVQEMREEYGRRWAWKTRPYSGIPELLGELRVRGIRLGVLTNKPHNFAVSLVERFFGPDTFAAIIGARTGIPHKPDPAGALEVVRLLGVTAGEVLYVGDTGTDMDTATAAGLESVGALWGFRPKVELETHGAVHLILRPADLLGCLHAPGRYT